MEINQEAFKAVEKRLKKRIEQNKEYITENVLEREEYIRRVSIVFGLNEALEDLKEVYNDTFAT